MTDDMPMLVTYQHLLISVWRSLAARVELCTRRIQCAVQRLLRVLLS